MHALKIWLGKCQGHARISQVMKNICPSQKEFRISVDHIHTSVPLGVHPGGGHCGAAHHDDDGVGGVGEVVVVLAAAAVARERRLLLILMLLLLLIIAA